MKKTMSRHIKQNVITQNHPMACMASSTHYQFSYPHASLWHVEIHQSILGIRDCPPCLPQGTWALGHSHDHAKNGLVRHPLLIFLRYVQVLQWSRQPRRMHDHPTSWSICLWPCSCTRPRISSQVLLGPCSKLARPILQAAALMVALDCHPVSRAH